MDLKNLFFTLIICGGIFNSYKYVTGNIQIHNFGKETQGEVIEKQVTDGYCYVRFRYHVNSREYVKSFRTKEVNSFSEGSKISIKYLPDKPEIPHVGLTLEKVNSEIYYVLLFLFAYFIYRLTKLMVASTRPNLS